MSPKRKPSTAKSNEQPQQKKLKATAAIIKTYLDFKAKLEGLNFPTLGKLDADDANDDDDEDEEDDDDKKKDEVIPNLRSSLKTIARVDGDKCGIWMEFPSFPVVETVDGKSWGALTVQDLVGLAKVSPYGDLKSGDTKVDAKVRKAFEIEGSRIRLSEAGNQMLAHLCRQFHGRLLGKDQSVNHSDRLYRIDKINIYPEGGHFKLHQDTPRPGCVGSIVVELPFGDRKGGDLVLTHNKKEWIPGRDVRDMVVATLFFSNVMHSVTEVKSGYRVTIAASVLKESDAMPEIESACCPWSEYGGHASYSARLDCILHRRYESKEATMKEHSKWESINRTNYPYGDCKTEEELLKQQKAFCLELATWWQTTFVPKSLHKRKMNENRIATMGHRAGYLTTHSELWDGVFDEYAMEEMETSSKVPFIATFDQASIEKNIHALLKRANVSSVGFILQWSYSLTEKDVLKSSDRFVVETLKAIKGVVVSDPIHVLLSTSKSGGGEYDNEGAKKSQTVLHLANDGDSDVSSFGQTGHFILIDDIMGERLLHDSQEGGMTGNEVVQGYENNLYVNLAVLVRLQNTS